MSPIDPRARLVLPPGPAGRCDDYRIGGSVVDHDPATGEWRMWYHCRDRAYSRPAPPTLGSGRIALARSDDGVAWDRVDGPEEHGAVMVPGDGLDRFDCGHIGISDVTRDTDGYRLWYFGGDTVLVATIVPALGVVPGIAMRAGQAHSGDGLHWERLPGATPSGALFEILEDELYVGWPNVVPLPGRTILQYTAPTKDIADYRTRVVELAADGSVTRLGDLRWADTPAAHDAGGIVTRQVLAHPQKEGVWLMAYTALDARHARSIALAESEDGLVWRRVPAPVLRPGAAGQWDDFGVALNRIVVAGTKVHLYYYGFSSLLAAEASRGIGLAVSDLAGDWRFERA